MRRGHGSRCAGSLISVRPSLGSMHARIFGGEFLVAAEEATAVPELPQPESTVAEWHFPQENGTFHESEKGHVNSGTALGRVRVGSTRRCFRGLMRCARERDQRLVAGGCCGSRLAHICIRISAEFEHTTPAKALPPCLSRVIFDRRRLVAQESGCLNQPRRGFSAKRHRFLFKGPQSRCVGSHRHPARRSLCNKRCRTKSKKRNRPWNSRRVAS